MTQDGYFIDGHAEWMDGLAREPGSQRHPCPEDDARVMYCYGDLDAWAARVDERNAAIREAWSNPELCARQSQTVRAAYAARSPESLALQRERQSASNKATWSDPERRRLMSERKKAWWAARKAQ
jgi:hypothetical protein